MITKAKNKSSKKSTGVEVGLPVAKVAGVESKSKKSQNSTSGNVGTGALQDRAAELEARIVALEAQLAGAGATTQNNTELMSIPLF